MSRDLHSTTIMSQRLLENYIRRRLTILNQLIDRRREAELRQRNEQRLRFMQRGRGREPRRVISQYYNINLNRTRNSRKFKSTQNVYNVNLKELPQNSPTFVRRLFRDILKNIKQKMQASPNDYLRVNIDHPSLDSPIWIEFTRSKIWTSRKFWTKFRQCSNLKRNLYSRTGRRNWIFFM